MSYNYIWLPFQGNTRVSDIKGSGTFICLSYDGNHIWCINEGEIYYYENKNQWVKKIGKSIKCIDLVFEH